MLNVNIKMHFFAGLLCVSSITGIVSGDHVLQKSISSRIIGGSVARQGQFPWQAAIFLDNSSGRYFCGGALITDQWILTAAHCVYNVQTFTIQLGSNTLLSHDDYRIILATSTYVVHPQYNQYTLENDIGLIKLRMPVEFTDYIKPIAISEPELNFDGTNVVATGWGHTRDSASGLNNLLYYVNLAIISNQECQTTYGSQIKNGMICAVGNYNEGICIGDTGGPLIKSDESGNPLHVGVASFMSQNGCESIDPTGYTRSDIYYTWISNITNTL